MYLDRLKLTDRVALVTGGANGIGLAIAEAFSELGARVTIADRDEAAIGTAIASLADKGFAIEGMYLDVTHSTECTAQIDALAKRQGRIDILVNNAGIARSETAAEDVADEHWLNVLDVNLNGTFWCINSPKASPPNGPGAACA
jgi:NAD(P)-dependent dehydrogenase (short-subunit alcohol dehydrogenase family)